MGRGSKTEVYRLTRVRVCEDMVPELGFAWGAIHPRITYCSNTAGAPGYGPWK